MKSGVVAQAFAAVALADAKVRLQGDLILEAVVGEEVMDHECGVTATIKRGYTADAAVVSEPSAPPAPLAVVPVSPGLWWFSVTVPGKADPRVHARHTFRPAASAPAVGVERHRQGRRHVPRDAPARGRVGPDQAPPALPGRATSRSIRASSSAGPKGVLVPFFVSEFMTIEYCCWYHPEEDPADVQREIEAHVHRAAQLDPVAARAPAGHRLEAQLAGVLRRPRASDLRGARRRPRAWRALGTRFAGRPEVNGFAAVEDCSFLNLGGIPTVSYGPGDLRVAHADDEHVFIDELADGGEDVRPPGDGLVWNLTSARPNEALDRPRRRTTVDSPEHARETGERQHRP